MKVINTSARLAVLLALVASSIAAIVSSGATISAFAQQSAVDFELPDLPQIPQIPETTEIPQREDLIPCLPPPACLLP